MTKVNFANNILKLQLDGSIYWPSIKTLILCDLHLEKSSFFAKLGDFLPPYDSTETLSRLDITSNKHDVKKIILLGDIFHDEDGIKRLSNKLKNYLHYLCKKYKVIWLAGNHDGTYKPKNAIFCYKYKIKNINFNHKSLQESANEMSGHYHPKATIKVFKTKISKPCFLVSKNRLILPAYGSFTGGIDSKSNIFKNIFKDQFKTYMLLNKSIIQI